LLERTAQTTVRTLPDLAIGKVGQWWEEGHKPSLFSPGKQMAYIVTYGNAGYEDAQDVVITTTLPIGTAYDEVGYGWQPSGGGIYAYAVGTLTAQSTGHIITFTVRHADTPQVSAPEFNTPFTIAARGGIGEDRNPGDNTTSVYIGVPDLIVDSWSVEPDPALVRANVPVTFTFTITVMNQGTGMAWNPDNTGGFFVDVFMAPVVSWPFVRDGEFYVAAGAIAPGAKSPPLIITTPVITPSRRPVFYVKVDNYGWFYDYGLVPEFNEMNNLGAPIYRVYLPLVRKG
jgi:uncharacterized repeat protein (TIGR01451 family)